MTLWLTLVWANPEVRGTLPAADAPAVWVEVDPDSPWTRAWLDALLRTPGRVAPVVAVSEAPLAAWARYDGRDGWSDLVVVADPDRATQARWIGPADTLGTTALWRGGEPVTRWLPADIDDERARATLAWVADPSTDPPRVKGYPTPLLSVYAYSQGARLTRRIARYARNPDDPRSGRLAVDLADQLLRLDELRPSDGRRAARLIERARPHVDADPAIDASLARARRVADGDLTPPPHPTSPTSVSGEALAGDAAVLFGWLRDRYSGFEDDDDALPGGWAAHEAAALAAARARADWPLADALDWLADVALAPIDDPHVSLRVDGAPARWLDRSPTLRYTALRLDADRHVVAGPEAWRGRRLDLPPVPSDPNDAALDTPYLFPTLTADGDDAWLVGSFDLDGRDTITVDGEALPAHPPRVGWDGPDDAWTVDGEVLAVRTMDVARLSGLSATAADLRARPRVLLDLRGNEGGSDLPAIEWISGFSGGRYASESVTYKTTHGWISTRAWPTVVDDLPAWSGQLDVVIDPSVCSSGETFTFLAAQVPGARLFGAPTAGCLGNGNVTPFGALPATGVRVAAGVTFHGDPIRPARESWGIFPDVWLDEPDPVAFVRGLPPRDEAR